MDAKKKNKLEAAGFAVGDAQDFLKLSDAEMEYIHIKRSLAKTLEQRRKKRNLTQVEAAKLLKTSQSRLAKMEHAEKSVSIDLLIRSTLSLGATTKELKQAL
jgi:predicted XRE-type DNA-binding protein